MVHCRRTPLGEREKLEALWEDGVYLAHRTVSGASIVGTSRVVFKTRTIRRKPLQDRWLSLALFLVCVLYRSVAAGAQVVEDVMPSRPPPMIQPP